MGRIFQTSTPRRSQTALRTLLPMKMKAKFGDKQRDKASYQAFYNVQKTRISARYPFLPSNQIERRIKQLWENSSAEKRATFCSSLSGTTPVKSPFRGTILKGLLKRAGCSGFRADPQRPEPSVPVLVSPPSIRLPGKATHGILRSSEKKRTSTPRVSFRLDGESMPSPIPVYNQAKRSLASRYLEHNGAETGRTTELSTNADCSKGNQPYQQHIGANGTSSGWNGAGSRQILPVVEGQNVDDALSTADVNMVKPASNDDGKNTGSKGMEDGHEILSDGIRQCSDELDSSTPTSQGPQILNTPTRQSRRAAAIAAKAKIRSPQVTQIKESQNPPKRKQTKITQYSSSVAKLAVIHRLKKTELSWEEKQMYEFQDEAKPAKSFNDTGNDGLLEGKKVITRNRLPKTQAPVEKNPEEYNLDSSVNKFVFSQESQSPSQTGPSDLKKSKKKGQGNSGGGLSSSGKKRGRPRKEAKAAQNLSQELEPPKKRGRPKKSTASPAQIEKMKRQPSDYKRSGTTEMTAEENGTSASQRKDGTENQDDLVIAENTKEHVPWMVSARPSSSSDEADEVDDDIEVGPDDDDDSDVALYQHYQLESEESSAASSATQESVGDISSQKVCAGFEAFCSNVLLSHEKTPSPSVESLLSASPASSDFIPSSTSEDTPEVPLIQEDFLLCPGSIPTRLSAHCAGSPMLLGLDSPLPSPLSRKQKMRLQNGDCSESSQSEAEDHFEAIKEDGTSRKPDRQKSRKRKQVRGVSTKTDPLTKSPLYAGDVNKPERTRGRKITRVKETALIDAPHQETSLIDAAPHQESGEKIKSKPYRQRGAGGEMEEGVADRCLNGADMRCGGSQLLVGWNHPSGLSVTEEAEDSSHRTTRQTSRGQAEKLTRSVLSELKSGSQKNKVWGDKNLRREAEKPLQQTKEIARKSPVKPERAQRYDRRGGKLKPDLLVGRERPPGLQDGEEEKEDVEERTTEQQDLCAEEEDNSDVTEKENCMSEGGETTGDGILCDLFPPCKRRVRRLHNPSKEQRPSPPDPVSAHLFLEENFFF